MLVKGAPESNVTSDSELNSKHVFRDSTFEITATCTSSQWVKMAQVFENHAHVSWGDLSQG